MTNKFRLHPIDRDIIRSISKIKLGVTPSRIAKTINIHSIGLPLNYVTVV